MLYVVEKLRALCVQETVCFLVSAVIAHQLSIHRTIYPVASLALSKREHRTSRCLWTTRATDRRPPMYNSIRFHGPPWLGVSEVMLPAPDDTALNSAAQTSVGAGAAPGV